MFNLPMAPPAISSQSTNSSSEEGTPSPNGSSSSLPGTNPKSSFSPSNIVLNSVDSCSKAQGSIVVSIVDLLAVVGLFLCVVSLDGSGSMMSVVVSSDVSLAASRLVAFRSDGVPLFLKKR